MAFRIPSRGAMVDEHEAIDLIRDKCTPVYQMSDLDNLIERIGGKRIVMLGEASHGTHQYYTYRSYISKKLIEEKQFNFICVEGDWPDCFSVNRYIKGLDNTSKNAIEVLYKFNRWPTWMWANWEIAALSEWIKQHNQSQQNKAGFFGLDVYSLWESLNSIIGYLSKVDPEALNKAKEAFRCFEPYKEDDGSSYALATRFVPKVCEDEVVALLKEIQKKLPQYDSGAENVFSTEQNALIAVNAEKYYRAMIRGDAESWNVRDTHMMETLERLLEFHGENSKAIVWAHNTHIGNSSATDMADDGMFNIGELVRNKYGNEAVLIGFGSYKGSVIAGSSWGAPLQRVEVPEGRDGSWEYLLHKAGTENKLLFMENIDVPMFSDNRIGHRAIGVVYRPQFERYGNYVPSVLPKRYDAFVYIDETEALHPLHITPNGHQMPETYPFGL
jgi:erythromycin esterase-like protein